MEGQSRKIRNARGLCDTVLKALTQKQEGGGRDGIPEWGAASKT
jgi:hypothetical protein